MNHWICNPRSGNLTRPPENFWRTRDAEGSDPTSAQSPSDYSGHLHPGSYESTCMSRFCINRHNGYINSLFMDFSVRKAGLKELWTLKWHRSYDTAGTWTKAGGVNPDAWPKWMKRYRDY